jgi:hypothetical protein
MPPEQAIRVRSPYARVLDLPPPFRPVRLREVGDAFAHARSHAAELGAGTLIFVDHFDLAEFAVVLEPDEALPFAWRGLYAGMVALADALAALAPPQKPIAIAWPDAIHVDGELVGGGRLVWPDGADAAEPPPWLVFGAMIRTVSMAVDGSGVRLIADALDDEGFGDDRPDQLVESFARHFMRVINHWEESGFTAVATSFASRLEPKQGVRYGVGDHGELLVTRVGKPVERLPLQQTLAVPSWLDVGSGGPRR